MKYLLFSISLFLFSSCYYDKEEYLYPSNSNCVGDSVKFTSEIVPIIQNNCVNCHGAVSPSGGIMLTNYTEIKASATAGTLYGTVSYLQAKKMPTSGKMSDCNVGKIKKWVDQGALNN